MLGVGLLSMIVAALASVTVFVLLDRYDRPTIEIVEGDPATITVQISGEVATPGVYPLPAGARLADLLDASGGLTDDADAASLNLAARVGDGEVVRIPSSFVATPVPVTPSSSEVAGPVNINTASLDELETLPGVGPVIGERIIAYRDENGPFDTVDNLTSVDGISDSLLEQLRPLITVE